MDGPCTDPSNNRTDSEFRMAEVTVGVGVGACIGRLHENGETCLLTLKATKSLNLGA